LKDHVEDSVCIIILVFFKKVHYLLLVSLYSCYQHIHYVQGVLTQTGIEDPLDLVNLEQVVREPGNHPRQSEGGVATSVLYYHGDVVINKLYQFLS
jgi:hypothetical protein